MRIIIMCKAPVPGKVKTRLMGDYSPDEAAVIHMAMATTVIERARRLFDDIWLAADDPDHAFFRSMGLPLFQQPDGDLGVRMVSALEAAFRDGAEAAMLLGTDSPHMTDGRLLAAARWAQEYDVVLGPVEDGGYDLIAMQKPYHELFEDIAWSTSRVLTQTCAVADRLQLSVRLLPESFDVDTPDALKRARQAGWQLPDELTEDKAR